MKGLALPSLLSILIFVMMVGVAPSKAQEAQENTSSNSNSLAYLQYETTAVVESFLGFDAIRAISTTNEWSLKETVPVYSQSLGGGIVAFIEITEINQTPDGRYELIGKLKSHSKFKILQLGDRLVRMDLSRANPLYQGTTALIVHERAGFTSARYKTLVYQGFAIGETAQTLWKGEALINFLGLGYYGVTDWLTVGALVPGYVTNNPNLLVKTRVYESDSNVFSLGGSLVRVAQTGQTTLNLNLLWDSVSSDSLIQHTLITLGLVTWEGAEDAAAIKALGSSSLQTGYEFILDNWNRVLVGPNYNFEKKAVGGYISHMWIYDRFHFQLSLNSTNIARFRINPSDGYYGGLDLFWRF